MGRRGWVLAVVALVLVVVGIGAVLKKVESDRRATAEPAAVAQVFGVALDGGRFDVVAEVDTGGCDTWGIWAEPSADGYAVLVPDQNPGRVFNDGTCELGPAPMIRLYTADQSPAGSRVTVNGTVFTVR